MTMCSYTVINHRDDMSTRIFVVISSFSIIFIISDILYVMVVMYIVYKHIRGIEKNALAYSITAYSINETKSRAAEWK